MTADTSHSGTLVTKSMKFFFSSRRRHTRFDCDWSSDVCSSDLWQTRHSTPRRLDCERRIMIADLKFALRQLRKAPAFTVTAVATVAICLGANLAIFAAIDSILLRPLPFPQSDRLGTILHTYPQSRVGNDGASITNYYERRGNIPAFSSLFI